MWVSLPGGEEMPWWVLISEWKLVRWGKVRVSPGSWSRPSKCLEEGSSRIGTVVDVHRRDRTEEFLPKPEVQGEEQQEIKPERQEVMKWRAFYIMLRSLILTHFIMGSSSDMEKFCEQNVHILSLNPVSGTWELFNMFLNFHGDSIWNYKEGLFEPWNWGNTPWIHNDRRS